MKDQSNKEKGNPFRVPAGYFEEVTRQIISDTSGQSEVGRHKRFLSTARVIYLAAASVAALALITVAVVRNVPSAPATKEAVIEIQEADHEYLYADIDLFMLEESLATASTDSEVTGLSNSELIEYLLLEDIELTDIYDNL